MNSPKPEKEHAPITLEERLVTAFVSAIAAAGTLLCFFVFNLVYASKGGGSEGPAFVYWIFSNTGLYVIGAAALGGFVAGSERMANIFGEVWGTNPGKEEQGYNARLATALLVVAVGVAAYFIYRSHILP